MGKPKNNSTNNNDKVKYENEWDGHLGTKENMVLAVLEDLNMKDICNSEFSDKVVIAKDSNGLYATGKSYVNAPLLDPYRMYIRIPVSEQDGTYTINSK